MAFEIDFITLFPELIAPYLQVGLVGQAVKDGRVKAHIENPRAFATDLHKSVDDRPYGGGDGMVMSVGPLERCLEARLLTHKLPVYYLSPQGRRLDHALSAKLASGSGIILICGRYGGVDERFLAQNSIEEISIGDYVLNGGEVAALAVLEAVSRHLPGVLGNEESVLNDSFARGWLEAPQFTRPPEHKGMKVPAVLTSGDHARIARWRVLTGLLRTYFRRPDLLQTKPPTREEWKAARELYKEMPVSERNACGLLSDAELPETLTGS